jgi:hypothetical protein
MMRVFENQYLRYERFTTNHLNLSMRDGLDGYWGLGSLDAIMLVTDN